MRIRAIAAAAIPQLDPARSEIQLVSVGVLVHHARPGDGYVIYEPNVDYSECAVRAICEVVSVYPEIESVSLDVRPYYNVLCPDARVRWRWVKNPYLCLDKSRVLKYGILDYFSSEFPPDQWSAQDLEDCVGNVFRPDLSVPTLQPKDGVVYLLRGSSLYKIGKTTNLNQRKKQVERDVQEDLEVIHTVGSNDITRAELMLHQKYGEVRQWGEWFALDTDQVQAISAITRLDF